MATTIQTFNSRSGFGIDRTSLISNTLDVKNVNTLELQNSNFIDGSSKKFILKGNSTTTLGTDNAGSAIPISNNTVNFITSHVIGVDSTGAGHYSLKNEVVIKCGPSGIIEILSSLDTIIKDSIPTGQTWTVSPSTPQANAFSYFVTRSGTSAAIKWFAYSEVVKVVWT